MCGIAGILRFDGTPASAHEVEPMIARLGHRGPDGAGCYARGGAALGHTRLAIIDPAGGHQPLFNEDGQVAVVFNGEVYNFRELESELRARGHTFKTRCDTEVIVHAWEEWGERCVERFRGMFAFVLADWRQGRFLLARDHLGIKPLLYHLAPDRLLFASELRALQAAPALELSLDLGAIDDYLCLQYIPAPRSIYREVRKLPPAHRLVLGFDGHTRGPERYWRPEMRPVHGRRSEEWLELIDEALRDSVRAHLVADVPFGAFLSGGIDSTLVVSYMAELLERPVKTFSIGFEEDAFNELGYAREAAERLGTEHHTEVVRPDALAILPELVSHYGEPFGDSSAIPTWYVSRLARQHVPMVLSGDGGDEAFAGYGTYMAWLERLGRRPQTFWKRALRPIAERLLPRRYERITPSLVHWMSLVSYLGPEERRGLWHPEHHGSWRAIPEPFEQRFAEARHYPPLSKAQALDLQTYLPNDILTKVDVASMIHSLEVRTPIVDVRVVELAATIPPELHVRQDAEGRWRGKLLLKRLLGRSFGESFLERPKQGFSIPAPLWLGEGGALRGELEERLLGTSSHLHELFRPPAIAELLAADRPGPLWLLLFLDEWLRQSAARKV